MYKCVYRGVRGAGENARHADREDAWGGGREGRGEGGGKSGCLCSGGLTRGGGRVGGEEDCLEDAKCME